MIPVAANRSYALRIAVENVEESQRRLRALGEVGEAALERISTAAPRVTANLDRVANDIDRSTGRMSANFQNLGYQVQDIAVQLQQGTNPLIVFAQQGSQIASVFGPWGAILGAAGAVVGALATHLLDFNEEAEKTPDLVVATGEAFSAAQADSTTICYRAR